MNKIGIFKRERAISAVLYVLLLIFWFFFMIKEVGFERYMTHFPIPLTMVGGGFISGFTICGGGAVSFPIFSKVLEMEPAVARDFALAIQSFGMTFASITIVLRKIKIEKHVILYSSIGGLIGNVLGNIFIIPTISSRSTKLLFTLTIASFGIALFLNTFVFSRRTKKTNEKIKNFKLKDMLILILIGICGGGFTSILGTGIDIITFSIVTLYYKLDEKVLNPTSDIIMAINSVIGLSFRLIFAGGIATEAMLDFPLAVPIVTLLAPVGAIVASKISRISIVKCLLFFICLEITTTFIIMKLSISIIVISISILIILFCFYLTLIKLGDSRERKYYS